ncbi:GNAT family N-acetyltransferase [Serinibacter salmoneus]|uniref:L-amino acid N-acyltransferase YncA n=1 Tax=Serinibacter salmoneus TaxID=556530 RepID=A0A2A9D0F9_9MICO|nr:GNAT family N-acetyltransferase [Serinibacter salmoneus]PFG19745.1 L-amino acid N-acyltransferase YncA [Serinibacter salmoneus]
MARAIDIHAAGETELAEVADLFEAAHRELRWSFEPEGLDAATTLRRLRAFAENHDARIAVAHEGAHAVGLLAAEVRPPGLFSDTRSVQVEAMYVRPEARRRGVGHALLAHLVEYADQAGAGHIVIIPANRSRAEVRFLSREGFVDDRGRRVIATQSLRRRLDHPPTPARGIDLVLARRRAAQARREQSEAETQEGSPRGDLPTGGEGSDQAFSSTRQVSRAELTRTSSSVTTATS